MTAREKRALLYVSRRLLTRPMDERAHWWRLWWDGLDLLPMPEDMPAHILSWAYVAESMAMSNRLRRAARSTPTSKDGH